MLLLAFLFNSSVIYPSKSGGTIAPPVPMVVMLLLGNPTQTFMSSETISMKPPTE